MELIFRGKDTKKILYFEKQRNYSSTKPSYSLVISEASIQNQLFILNYPEGHK